MSSFDPLRILSGLIGIAVLVGLVALIYAILILVDATCSSSFAQIPRISSPMQSKAGLLGLTKEERKSILEKLFEKNSFAYDKEKHEQELREIAEKEEKERALKEKSQPEPEESLQESNSEEEPEDQTNIKSTPSKDIEEDPAKEPTTPMEKKTTSKDSDIEEGELSVDELTAPLESKDEDEKSRDTDIEGATEVEGKVKADKDQNEGQEDDEEKGDEDVPEEAPENVCSICLNEYENKCRVVTGTRCNHMFHHECLMEWLTEGHDDCPFCRKAMITPRAMYDAALQVLDNSRIEEMRRGTRIAVPEPEPESTRSIIIEMTTMAMESLSRPLGAQVEPITEVDLEAGENPLDAASNAPAQNESGKEPTQMEESAVDRKTQEEDLEKGDNHDTTPDLESQSNTTIDKVQRETNDDGKATSFKEPGEMEVRLQSSQSDDETDKP